MGAHLKYRGLKFITVSEKDVKAIARRMGYSDPIKGMVNQLSSLNRVNIYKTIKENGDILFFYK